MYYQSRFVLEGLTTKPTFKVRLPFFIVKKSPMFLHRPNRDKRLRTEAAQYRLCFLWWYLSVQLLLLLLLW